MQRRSQTEIGKTWWHLIQSSVGVKYLCFHVQYIVTPLILGSVSSIQFFMQGNPTGTLETIQRARRRTPVLRPAAVQRRSCKLDWPTLKNLSSLMRVAKINRFQGREYWLNVLPNLGFRLYSARLGYEKSQPYSIAEDTSTRQQDWKVTIPDNSSPPKSGRGCENPSRCFVHLLGAEHPRDVDMLSLRSYYLILNSSAPMKR
jgi:hypothetical protein